MKRIGILIPVFNKLELTKKCIESLLPLILAKNLKNTTSYLVVIDDGSQDGTGEWIEQNCPEVILLKGDGNLWWSGGINMGVKYAIERDDTDYVLLWNNDILPESTYFTELDKVINEVSENEILGSKIYTLNPPDQVWAFGAVFNPRNGDKYMIGFEQADGEEFESVREVDWLPGMGTLVPVSTIEKIGYWDQENFPQYHGDSDFTYRAKINGYKILVYPQLKLWNDSQNTGISHQGKLSNLTRLLTDTRSIYHLKKNILFINRFSTSYLAYWPLIVSYYKLFGGFLKWKLLSFIGLKRSTE